MIEPDSDDHKLIAAFLAGDGEATARIDSWITGAAFSFRRRLGDDWEDVLQDVRLEIMRLLQKGDFHARSSLKTYLWRVTCHSCLDHLRAQKRRGGVETDAGDELPDLASIPGTQSTDTSTRDLLLKVLDQMSPECKHLWRMILDGLSYQEMSRRLGVSAGALRVRVLRCRRRAVEIRDQLLGDHPGLQPAGNIA